MPRKDNRDNPLEVEIRMVTVPRVKSLVYWQTLLRSFQSGADLPRGWDVEIWWRNPRTRVGLTKRWRSDSFVDAIADSRAGFNDVVYGIIAGKINQHRRSAYGKRRV